MRACLLVLGVDCPVSQYFEFIILGANAPKLQIVQIDVMHKLQTIHSQYIQNVAMQHEYLQSRRKHAQCNILCLIIHIRYYFSL